AAVATVNTVVSNTITQAASIATLQSGKQTRPNDIADNNEKCPAYKQCLLVEDEQGVPHWYQITDPFRDFVRPIITNNVAPASTTNSSGFTQLEYIESTGTQYIDTDVKWKSGYKIQLDFTSISSSGNYAFFGASNGAAYNNGEVSVFWNGGQFDRVIPTSNSVSISNRFGTYANNTRYLLTYDKNATTVNSYSNANEGFYDTYVGTNNIFLFGTHRTAGDVGNAPFKLHSAKMWDENNTLVRNFVPVRNNATGKYGMYDTVGGRFYGNADTSGDDFTPGPIVENDADVPGMTWTATWAANATTGVIAGTVYGEGLCNAVAGTASTAATSAQTSSANWSVDGANCWCRATGVDDGNESSDVDGVWVFLVTASSAADCAGYCARSCLSGVRDSASFLSAVFRM
ncbi:MAG: hypothetical protein ACLRFM_01695, partial [Alphaproteobacteria bacterium]